MWCTNVKFTHSLPTTPTHLLLLCCNITQTSQEGPRTNWLMYFFVVCFVLFVYVFFFGKNHKCATGKWKTFVRESMCVCVCVYAFVFLFCIYIYSYIFYLFSLIFCTFLFVVVVITGKTIFHIRQKNENKKLFHFFSLFKLFFFFFFF